MSARLWSNARVFLFLIALLAFTSLVHAENRVDLGCPQAIDVPGVETMVQIPVHITNDDTLSGFTLGFNYNSADVEIDSFSYAGTIVDPSAVFFFKATYVPEDNEVLIGWTDFTFSFPLAPQTDGLLFTLYARVPAGAAAQCIDIDTTWVPPAGDFIFAPKGGGQVTPNYYDCGTSDIDIGNACGGAEVPPIAICAAVTVDADENCEAMASIDDGSNDPEGQDITLTQVPAGPYPLGETLVQLIVTDTDMLADTCEATVTVEDNTSPVVTCPADVVKDVDAGQCGAVAEFTATATDNCGVDAISYNPPSGSFFDAGTTMVEVVATDASLNADTCFFQVIVNDNELPVPICPGDITVDNDAGECGAVVSFSIDATDNCPDVTVAADPASGSMFPVGITLVTVTATDKHGNQDACTFNVTVNDTEDPVPVCPGDITVSNDPGECGAVVNFEIGVTDNCPDASVAAEPASGSLFPLGLTQVTVTATDAHSNETTCQFNVTVEDNEAPVAVCHADTTVLVDAGIEDRVVEFTSSATDNCDGATINCTPPSGSTFPLGVTEVTCIALDAAGNADTCGFNVTITQELNPDFEVRVSPDTLYATEGIATPLSFTVNVNSIDGFVTPVTLSRSALPGGVTLDFADNPVTPTGSTELAGTTDEAAPAGLFIVIVTGSLPGKADANHADTVFVKVSPCAEDPVVGLSQDFFEVTITEGETAEDLEVYITNEAGCGTLMWSAFPDVGWVTLVPDNGSVDAGDTPGDLMAIELATAGLSVGDHTANVTVSPDSKAVSSGISIVVHVEALPESEDTVYVSHETGFPGQKVAVDVTFKNDELLSGISVGLMWSSSELFLDSVSYIGSRIDYINGKVTIIDNPNRHVGLGALVVPPELQVPIGSGLWGTLYFTVNASATPGVVDIDTVFISPGVELVFNDSLAHSIYPQFEAGSVTIEESAPLAGFVEDEFSGPIGGANVELYDMWPPVGGPIATTMSNPDGSFLFDLVEYSGKQRSQNTAAFELEYYVRAYKAGYYPGLTPTPFPNSDVLVILKQNGGTVTPTYEWVDLYCDEAYFDDLLLPVGSVVEAYDPTGILCGQWNVTEEGRFGFMPVYVDDPWSGEDEGCEVGDMITLMVNGYEVEPFGGPLYWTGNGDRYEACFEGYSIIEVCIPLHVGWNLISWNVDTEFDDIEMLAADVMDNVDVILSFESVGLTYDPLLPEFSTLSDVDHFHGAWFRMNDADTLCVEGLFVDPSTPIFLEQNWNLVSYLPNDAMPIEDALDNIWSYIVVVLGYDGGGLTYDMAHPELATLTDLAPTFGYWIKTTQAATLMYPGGAPFLQGAPADATYAKESQVPTVAVSNTWINLYGSNVTVDGRSLSVGSVIQAYNESDILVGEFTVREAGKLGFMPVYGFDSYAPDGNGAGNGEVIRLTVNGIEAEETVNWTTNGDRIKLGNFHLTSTAAGDDGNLPRDYTLSQNYPNPFNPETQIEYYLPSGGQVEVAIYNVLGTKIKTLVSEYQSAGSYTVKWYGDSDAGIHVASGVYFYKLTAGEFSETRKMMLLK